MSHTKLPPLPLSLSNSARNSSPRHYDGLNGPSYSLTSVGGAQKYALPPSAVLQPHIDTRAGTIDTWPAHALGPSPPDRNPGVVKQSNEFMPKGVHKPKFLEQLEAFLQKELRSLDCTEMVPSEKRLQAFREVFEYLIEDFKTYKPLLSAVKHEYEMMLVDQRETIRELEPLKSMLVTVSEQCEKKLLAMKQEEKSDMITMKGENRKLQQIIEKLREEKVSLQVQVEKLQEELGAEYLRYRNECDARKMLIADINELKYQQEDSKKSSMEDDREGKEDVTFLKLALKKAREDLEMKNQKLAKMEADYGDVVPRRDFEKLEALHSKIEADKEKLAEDNKKLMQEHNALLDVYKKVVEQRDQLSLECDQMRRSATPRPSWEKCGQYIEGGTERWNEISQNKTSDELVNVLLAEMTGQDIAQIQSGTSTAAEYFEGQGTGPEVPRFLRYEGKVRNRRLGKRDTSLLIKDIWQEKAAHDAEKPPDREDLGDFLYVYLQRRFGVENMIIEWGYNLYDACNRYNHDPRIGLFYGILQKEIDEAVYHDQLVMLEKLYNSLTKADLASGNQGSLSRSDMEQCLRAFFPLKDDDSIEALLKAAEQESPGETIQYKNLFTEDEEGRAGPFVDKTREQDKLEQALYVKEITTALGSGSEVTLDEVRNAIQSIDPEITQDILDKYIKRGFNSAVDKIEPSTKIETTLLTKRLQTGSIKRIGKKP
ncbi:translin-associated factor X-interacting protein 1-like [Actinia tenebrosa]|uniref:Translin-associated factor X-interacting protein 1-like n=1 Tax=Actinia tenebrosa TaxID=6105 RepID=A0A6P8I067_ACTTE|nr:translin-associated factor X-interacting protein 1-like [Actinia tenebrosa]